MGSKLSKTSIRIFEFFNEILIAVGAGFIGIMTLVINSFLTENLFETLLVILCTGAILLYFFRNRDVIKPSRNKFVFITGCDSGLGFSLAQHAYDVGFSVIAGCLKSDSEGAQQLRELYRQQIIVLELDITDAESVNKAVQITRDTLCRDPQNELYAFVNNAGVMTFGEFEWQTEKMIFNQININLGGTCLVTKAFVPLLRKYKGRLINVTSHCARATLPGLAVYGATKSALDAWSDGIRVELNKYGVSVIKFVPGSFVTQSKIMADHMDNVYEMQKNFTSEQKCFYSDYFKRYNTYLTLLTPPANVTKIQNSEMYSTFTNCLVDLAPLVQYKCEPLRYKLYHLIFQYAPAGIRDFAVLQFVGMPSYKNNSNIPPHFVG